MSKTIYIDCNRLNSIDKDSDTPSEWTYNLKQSVKIPAGSDIQIQNSFINQKGITGGSIEIEDDILEEISYYLYTTDEQKLCPYLADVGQSPFMDCLRMRNLNRLFSTPVTGASVGLIANRYNWGGSQLPFFLYDYIPPSAGQPVGAGRIMPKMNTKRIQIKKGVYGINQLTELITDQINGKRTLNNIPTNPIDHLLGDRSFNGNLCERGDGDSQGVVIENAGGAGLTAVVGQYDLQTDLGTPALETVAFEALSKGYIFIDAFKHQTHIDQSIKQNASILMDWGTGSTDPQYGTMAVALFTNNRTIAPVGGGKKKVAHKTQAEYQNDIDDYNLGGGYTIGTTNFNISYDTDRNGFSLNSLHEDYIIPSHDVMGFVQPNAGDIAVGFRNPTNKNEGMAKIFTEPAETETQLLSGLRKPVSRNGGALIYNFGLLTAKKYGDKKLNGIDETLLDNFKFKDYFNTEGGAKTAWSKTLWSRLGFTYEQLNTEEYQEELVAYNRSYRDGSNPKGLKLKGITTDAEVDISIVPSVATLTNPNVVGVNGDVKGYSSAKVWSGLPSNNPRRERLGTQGTNDNVASYVGSNFTYSTTDLSITRPKAIVAEKLPTLSQYGYYLITSNVVSENDDIVQKGAPLPLLGVVPKSSLSSQDFISSENDIVHTTTQDQVINNIKIQVFNPDLTSPSLDNASSIILKITMPIINDSPPPPDKKKK